MTRTPPEQYNNWLAQLTVTEIRQEFERIGVSQVLVKNMTGNQGNTKQQIYCGTDFSAIGLLPMSEPKAVNAGTSKKRLAQGRKILQAQVPLYWLGPQSFEPLIAPHAKLIFYHQYPEVRLSGFLRGCVDPPSSLLSIGARGKEDNRLLLLGVKGTSGSNSANNRVYGLVLPPEAIAHSAILAETRSSYGPFHLWTLDPGSPTEEEFFKKISEIVSGGPYLGRILRTNGTIEEYTAPNAGGYTLEALLDVAPNGDALPDFLGWEVKSFSVKNLDRIPKSTPLTLMTPEPDGGLYIQNGARDFISLYGVRKVDKPTRKDFNGVLRVGAPPNPRTGVRLDLDGYSGYKDWDPAGSVVALAGESVVASWTFTKLIKHWVLKHAKTAYVPYSRDGNTFTYSSTISFGQGAQTELLLAGLANGLIYWDPGLHGVTNEEGHIKVRKRNQFRARYADLPELYEKFETQMLGT